MDEAHGSAGHVAVTVLSAGSGGSIPSPWNRMSGGGGGGSATFNLDDRPLADAMRKMLTSLTPEELAAVLRVIERASK